ncbi:SAF domain-containing protein [Tessaracoccus sp. OH4464_COT-324]|uniref:SAF domain-containing protein n=1 Tax=Tessaracoccus sp. OH4464_COT-324 TaxID=2491059 RepID=UPI000F631A14|nr:SAF domain-containing protein [Tessaracoccus sp. OH4464_COT-324]RRD45865.1 hypothetical protein EII42_09560 [Tessaracoccus sp. OH4464_COT-324]
MQLIPRLVSFVRWHRRWLAALCAAACLYALGSALVRPAEPTATLPVAARRIAVGEAFTPDVVRVEQVPLRLAGDGEPLDLEQLAGAHSAVPLSPGQIIYRSAVSFPGQARPDHVLVPVSIRDDGLRELLTPGARVDLVVALHETAEVVASGSIAASPASSGSPTRLTGAGGMVLVEIPASEAAGVAVLGQSGQLSVVLTPSLSK